jgi:hypothetical protein
MSATDLSSLSLEPAQGTGARHAPDPWAAQTELATRFVGSQEDAPAGASGTDPHIGKPVGANTWELFVSCAPSDALALQFETRALRYVALHGLGRISALQFLAEVAGCTASKVQRLLIRRQGFGTELACLYFVDVPTTNQQALRFYASDVKADDGTRMLLSRLLLSKAEMVAVLLGDLTGIVVDSGVTALAQAARDGRKAPVTMVALPFAADPGVDAALAGLARYPDLPLRRSARLARAADGWTFLASTWNGACQDAQPGAVPASLMLLPGKGGSTTGIAQAAASSPPSAAASLTRPALAAELPPVATAGRFIARAGNEPPANNTPSVAGSGMAIEWDAPASAPKAPPAAVRAAEPPAASPAQALQPTSAVPAQSADDKALQAQMLRHALAVSGLKGVHSCCIFHARTLALQAQAGAVEPAAELMVRQGRVLVATMQAASQALGLGKVVREGVIALDAHHLLLHLVPGAPNMVLVALLKVGNEAELSIFKSELNRLNQVVKSALVARAG